MAGIIDLHTHSSVSDGTESPTELVAAGVRAKLSVLALTDHDTTDGWAEAFAAVRGTGLEILPGIELSTQLDYASVHILGYLVDPQNPELVACLAEIRDERLRRARAMTARIAVDYPLSWEDVLAQTTAGATIGRPHIADALVARGYVPDRNAAFATILHWRGGYYRPHTAPLPATGVRLITQAGGVAVLAHPGSRTPEGLFTKERVAQLVDAGLFGVELWHRDNSSAARVRWGNIARSFALVTTGSSDYHGEGKDNRLGENWTKPEVYQAIVSRGSGSRPVNGLFTQ